MGYMQYLGLNDTATEFLQSANHTAKQILSTEASNSLIFQYALDFMNESDRIQTIAIEEGKDGDEDYWFSEEIDKAEKKFLDSLTNGFLTIKAIEKLDEVIIDSVNPFHHYWELLRSWNLGVSFFTVLN